MENPSWPPGVAGAQAASAPGARASLGTVRVSCASSARPAGRSTRCAHPPGHLPQILFRAAWKRPLRARCSALAAPPPGLQTGSAGGPGPGLPSLRPHTTPAPHPPAAPRPAAARPNPLPAFAPQISRFSTKTGGEGGLSHELTSATSCRVATYRFSENRGKCSNSSAFQKEAPEGGRRPPKSPRVMAVAGLRRLGGCHTPQVSWAFVREHPVYLRRLP